MIFNCNDCTASYDHPSIVISIIDDFAGLSYGRYCQYECAKNDLNKYFDNPNNVEIVETAKFEIKVADNVVDQIYDTITDKVFTEKVLWTQVLLDQMNSKPLEENEIYSISPSQLSKRSLELNSIWNDVAIDDHMRCKILAYWLSSHDETKNMNISNPEDIIFPKSIINGAVVSKAGTTPIVVTKIGTNEFLISASSDDIDKPSNKMILRSEVKFY